MKKILKLIAVSVVIASCSNPPKDYVTLSGKITNKNSDSIVIANRKLKFKKVIKVDENGAFSDTLKVKNNFYQLFDGKEYATLFLKNGYDINLTLDTKEFDETLSFTGNGADESNFLVKSALMQENFFKDDSLFFKDKENFKEKLHNYHANFTKSLEETQSEDSLFLEKQNKDIKGFKKYVSKMYEDKNYILTKLTKGTPSPLFTDYENSNGGKTSLADFKGKYVYIDFWATWCGYCKAEIPALKKIAEKYKDKNIAFLGISIDPEKFHERWKKMVKEKDLPGTQVYFNQDKKFTKDFRIGGIPRFAIIDPDGNIVMAEAPRPSDPKLEEIFNDLNI